MEQAEPDSGVTLAELLASAEDEQAFVDDLTDWDTA